METLDLEDLGSRGVGGGEIVLSDTTSFCSGEVVSRYPVRVDKNVTFGKLGPMCL